MDRFEYPVRLVRDDNATLLVTSPDFPELTSFGNDEADALAHAGEALKAIIGQYMDRDLDVPGPSSPKAGMHLVALPALLAAKVALWRRVRENRRSLRQTAADLGLDKTQLRRLMDPRQASRFDDVERALAMLGTRLEIKVHSLVHKRTGKAAFPAFPSVVDPAEVEFLGFGKSTIARRAKSSHKASTGEIAVLAPTRRAARRKPHR